MRWYTKMTPSKVNDFVEIAEYIFSLDYIKKILKIYDCEVLILKDYCFNKNNHLVHGRYNYIKHIISIYVVSNLNHSLCYFIDTIAHEIAHIAVLAHDKKHRDLKNQIKKLIKLELFEMGA